MPYGGQNISLNDLNENSYVGIGFPFNNIGIFRQTFTTLESTKANLLNFFLTNSGDRYMHVEFGAGFRDRIFEVMNEGIDEDIREVISYGITEYFPGVQIDQLDITPQYDRNTIIVQMKFSLTSTGESDSIDLSVSNYNIAANNFQNSTREPGQALPGIRSSFS